MRPMPALSVSYATYQPMLFRVGMGTYGGAIASRTERESFIPRDDGSVDREGIVWWFSGRVEEG